MQHSFLVELGTEELPPTSLKVLSRAFTDGITSGLHKAGLNFGEVQSYATPRRLSVYIQTLDERTALKNSKLWGPPAKIAFNEAGEPSKAALAFAQKNNLHPNELRTENDGKVDKLVHEVQSGGEASVALLPDIVCKALMQLPVKKRMRWGASRVEFVRPVHWLLMLADDKVVDAEILGLKAGNTSRGHRFHANRELLVRHASDYVDLLQQQGKVVVDMKKRQQRIREQVEQCAKTLGGEAVIDTELLEEVAALVEWPVALAGQFDPAFLAVPAEALISTMKSNQKYFHMVDKHGALLPHFITVSNIESQDSAAVIAGNEKVIRPRLADAAFFFETDKKHPLIDNLERLKSVMFQAQLGSLFDKAERIEKLTTYLAAELTLDDKAVRRAAQLCKCDLVSNMVYEFPEMQGIAGRHYAQHDGEEADIAHAIEEHYLPKFAGDALPETTAGILLALADRIDTLVGIFGIGQIPSGSKDPFALRRAALGALRLMVEKELDLDLRALISEAIRYHSSLPQQDTVLENVLVYMLERFRAWYEEENIRADIFQSVHAKNLSQPLDINRRVHAVAAFCQLPEAAALASANKRVSNILNKQTELSPEGNVSETLLVESSEKQLHEQISSLEKTIEPLLAAYDYKATLSQLASLRETVDLFFEKTMVMCEDIALRKNRLALLKNLRHLFLHVADISLLDLKQ